jgi:dTDP-4-amino-4,6-dideoxygalactose transaminase
MKPVFIDVINDDWQIDCEAIKKLANEREIKAVMVVSPFGAPVNLEKWNYFIEETGIPVVIDAAAGFDSFSSCGPRLNNLLVTISLHATKVSGIGEGAVILGNNSFLINQIKLMGNFGFQKKREAIIPGMNTKLSEYTAACGLAFLDNWPTYRGQWSRLKTEFIEEVNNSQHVLLPPDFHGDWVSSYGNVRLVSEGSSDETINKLEKNGVEARKWWGNGCHTQPAYQAYDKYSLLTTEMLARSVLGLPYWIDIGTESLKEVFYKLGIILS